jgi:hypothetical protein
MSIGHGGHKGALDTDATGDANITENMCGNPFVPIVPIVPNAQ